MIIPASGLGLEMESLRKFGRVVTLFRHMTCIRSKVENCVKYLVSILSYSNTYFNILYKLTPFITDTITLSPYTQSSNVPMSLPYIWCTI